MAEPAHSTVALLLVDVINDMVFEGSESLVRHAEPMAARLRALKHRARDAGLPTIYINDNFGKWRSDFRALVDHCLNDDVPGRNVARALRPDADDYFVLKPKQSAFYGTTLDTLLRSLGIRGVILNHAVTYSDSRMGTRKRNRYAELQAMVVEADWGGMAWGGRYKEVISGIHRNDITVEGTFVIRQVLTGNQLRKQPYD